MKVQGAAHGVQNYGNDPQQRPNQHDIPDVELTGVHPTPDEGPDAAGDDADYAVQDTAILKLLD